MSFAPGDRLGPYEVTGAIGAGNMGEVYRARDPRLERDVAVKVLPASYSADPERLHRFEQEARAAAALNHPNILAVFDIGAHDGVPYVVSELLEGETLRERLNHGAIPPRKAIEIAVQIARGLAAAHEKGIVHRDLKPENIFITHDGRAKILDFGLAKLMEADQPASILSNVATTARYDTQPGMMLGTMGYMAPEQLRGLAVDHRADIFALGVILYEMLSGHHAFSGATTVDTMTAILKEDPEDLPVVERRIPPSLAQIVDRCLEKVPAGRFQSAGDLAFALESVASQSDATPLTVPVRARGDRWRLARTIALVIMFAGAISLGTLFLTRSQHEQPLVRFSISPPQGWNLTSVASAAGVQASSFVISPDGHNLAFVARNADGGDQLWIRPLDTLVARALTGTEGATSPFWSPDGLFVGFFADGKVKKMAVGGGAALTVCEAQGGRGGAWSPKNVIVFGSLINGPLQKVSANGGVPTPATNLGLGEIHSRPNFLPDGRHFLYSSGRSVYVASIDSTQGTLLLNDVDSRAVVYADAHLLFSRGTTLMAQPFDSRRLVLAGEAVPVVDQVQPESGMFSASGGVLAYWSGPDNNERSSLVWMDRSGQHPEPAAKSGEYWNIALSPNERRIAASMYAGVPRNRNVWVIDVPRSVSSQITFPPGGGSVPSWSPDGKQIAFFSARALYRKSADGEGTAQLLAQPTWMVQSGSVDWSHDGASILYSGFANETRWDLWIVPTDGSAKPIPFLQTRFDEDQGAFSPDVKWIAYSSNESGQHEIYVQPFPSTGAKYRISRNGGVQPLWRGDGRELFYLAPDSTLMAAAINTVGGFEPGIEKPLFATGLQLPPASFSPMRTTNNNVYGARRRYAVTSDGKRFLMSVPEKLQSTAIPMTVVLNWTAVLPKQ